jgi:methionine sulfoxide reductase heme-binding subunit
VKKYPRTILASTILISIAVIVYAFGQETEELRHRTGLLTSVRLSAIYFLIAFSVGPLTRLSNTGWLRPLLANRRYIGLSFALMHTVHLYFIALWVRANPDKFDPVPLWIGGSAYLFMYLQAITSNDYSVSRLRRYWRWLHNYSTYLLWLVITVTFAGSESLTAKIYTAFLLSAMAVRLIAAFKPRT